MNLLDLFSGAGGAGVGYQRAGFHVIGVDIAWQGSYPFPFLQRDVMAPGLVAELVEWSGASAIHASPPCQVDSQLRHYQPETIDERYSDLIAPTRELLKATGLPYVIKNVETARPKLHNPVMLCGTMFGLRMYRHRLFETSFELQEPIHPAHTERCIRNGYLPTTERPFMSIHGGKHSKDWQRRACEAMGVDWMAHRPGTDRETAIREVCEAIPPLYTEYIGKALMKHLSERVA